MEAEEGKRDTVEECKRNLDIVRARQWLVGNAAKRRREEWSRK